MSILKQVRQTDMSGFDDDFIHTIDEDDNVQVIEELSEEEVVITNKKRKVSKKAAKKNATKEDMDDSFTFNIEGGGAYKNNTMDWDFATTREKLKAQVWIGLNLSYDILSMLISHSFRHWYLAQTSMILLQRSLRKRRISRTEKRERQQKLVSKS